jgi:cysteine desulfuration protein SufE
MSKSQETKAQELIEAFEFLGDWENRYEYLMDMGKELPPMPPEEHIEENLVHGCQSQVWVTAGARDTPRGRVIHINADSNSAITKGIVAILYRMYAGEAPRDILLFDIDGLMQTLQLDQHLSPSRRNGMAGMISRIKALAASNAGGEL